MSERLGSTRSPPHPSSAFESGFLLRTHPRDVPRPAAASGVWVCVLRGVSTKGAGGTAGGAAARTGGDHCGGGTGRLTAGTTVAAARKRLAGAVRLARMWIVKCR